MHNEATLQFHLKRVFAVKHWIEKSQKMKLRWNSTIATSAVLACSCTALVAVAPRVGGQELRQPGVTRTTSSQAANSTFLSYAQFEIPFNVDATGSAPALVQLWVSTDDGITWQMHGSTEPRTKRFDFRAASEGTYLFSVRTVDASGVSFPSNSEPLRVQIDTTKPHVAVRGEINGAGQLVIDVRVIERFLDADSAVLRLRSDRETSWRDVPISTLIDRGDYYDSQTIVNIAPCREVALVFAIKDQANNTGEATYKLNMPRTAAGDQEMRFASTGHANRTTKSAGTATAPTSIPPMIEGATPWELYTATATPALTTQPKQSNSPGKLVGNDRSLTNDTLNLGLLEEAIEELPLPAPVETSPATPRVQRIETVDQSRQTPLAREQARDLAPAQTPDQALDQAPDRTNDLSHESPEIASSTGQAYHCKSLAFSLDYSVEASGGAAAVADVELWGTEDGGRSWHMWGSDPDRQSPFDVRVGNDGLFGFRMVIVGANGIVSNRPKDGDIADVWINVDSTAPSVKITRAVYGEGLENGMLVIDYTCSDTHLVERPVTLSFSEHQAGPWTTIATGLKNTGMYLWKADPNLPEHVYLKIDVVDKAGNTGVHRLDLPIDIKGLAPRGRIQGFRPIIAP